MDSRKGAKKNADGEEVFEQEVTEETEMYCSALSVSSCSRFFDLIGIIANSATGLNCHFAPSRLCLRPFCVSLNIARETWSGGRERTVPMGTGGQVCHGPPLTSQESAPGGQVVARQATRM